jgi:hypothetical protein
MLLIPSTLMEPSLNRPRSSMHQVLLSQQHSSVLTLPSRPPHCSLPQEKAGVCLFVLWCKTIVCACP